jgi:hypothetical protein
MLTRARDDIKMEATKHKVGSGDEVAFHAKFFFSVLQIMNNMSNTSITSNGRASSEKGNGDCTVRKEEKVSLINTLSVLTMGRMLAVLGVSLIWSWRLGQKERENSQQKLSSVKCVC